jgi:redox-sensitive bicupin YhaK (pirin superfamily)
VSNTEYEPVETTSPVALVGVGGGDGTVELLEGREVPLGRYSVVRRMLPHRERRTVGAWCFVDQFGPDAVLTGPGMVVPPHPHCGLQTVTWLVDGAVRHDDSLGSGVVIRPGGLNLMTAGYGIAHSEQSPADRPPLLHGLQLWVALPAADRDRPAAFEHHEDLPGWTVDGAEVTLLLGTLDGHRSPATAYTPIVGAQVALRAPGPGTVRLAVDPSFEHGVVAMDPGMRVDGLALDPGSLLYLPPGRTEVVVERTVDDAPARAFLLGGEPFEEELVMWWNFVARSHEEILQARADWAAGQRFGEVTAYDGERLPAPPPPNTRLRPRPRHDSRPG